jgi:hypothetical protein
MTVNKGENLIHISHNTTKGMALVKTAKTNFVANK